MPVKLKPCKVHALGLANPKRTTLVADFLSDRLTKIAMAWFIVYKLISFILLLKLYESKYSLGKNIIQTLKNDTHRVKPRASLRN